MDFQRLMTALVILPGLDGTAATYAGFVAAARKWFDPIFVVAYPTDKVLTYARLERLVRVSLPNERFVLLGESFSGPIALSIAADPPGNLAGLVLSTTFARWFAVFAISGTIFAPIVHRFLHRFHLEQERKD